MSSIADSRREHAKAQQLLPWLLAGTLEGAELEMVQAHLETCAQCRAELAWERSLRAAGQRPGPAIDPEQALARLLPRLGPQQQRAGILDRWKHALAANDGRWLRGVAIAQFAVIAALAGLLIARPAQDGAPYQGLGAAGSAQGNVVVVFKPDTPERELRRILQQNQARVVDGPTATDAYVLDVPAPSSQLALQRLRSEQAVVLAQPLVAEGRP